MKNLKKKLVALGLGLATMASSAMSVSASALEYDYWSAYYVPYTGSFYADSTVVRVSGLKWTSSQMEAVGEAYPDVICPSIEFEIRPATPTTNTKNIWGSKNGALSSNIPSAGFEFQLLDFNDVSFVIPNINNCEPEQSYYATQKLNPREGGYTDVTYDFECELGRYYFVVGESYPLRCATYPKTASFGRWYSWDYS